MRLGGKSFALGLAAILAATAATAGAGCGEDDEPKALAAVAAIQRAFAGGDLAGVCARMSGRARRQAGLFAHGRPGQCAADLAEAFALTQPGPVAGTRPMPRPTGARISDSRATVVASVTPRGELDLPLVDEDERWRLDSFFGSSESAAREAAAANIRGPFPPAGDERVVVADGPDFECFPLVSDRFPEIEGGCAMTARGVGVRLTIDTPFGRYDFGHCKLEYVLAIDATGRTWTSRVAFGSPGSAGCADFDACQDADGQALPWKGRIHARGGGLVHEMRACLDTCVGYFTGALVVDLERERGGWRATGDGAPVGRSGLVLHGQLRIQPAAIRIEVAT